MTDSWKYRVDRRLQFEKGKWMWKKKHTKSAVKSRTSKESRKFLYTLYLLMLVPLLTASVVYIVLYVRSELYRTRNQLQTYGASIQTEFENTLGLLRDYYISVTSRSEYRWLREQQEIPYREISRLEAVQEQLEGDISVASYVDEYYFINVRYGWILSNYGMVEMEDVINSEDLDKVLTSLQTDSRSVFFENLDYLGEEDQEVTPTGKLNLSGENLILTDASGSQLHTALIVKLRTNAFQSMLSPYARDMQLEAEVLNPDGSAFCATSSLFSDVLEPEKTLEDDPLASLSVPETIHVSKNGTYWMYQPKESSSGFRYLIGSNITVISRTAVELLLIMMIVGVTAMILVYYVRILTQRISGRFSSLELMIADQKSHIEQLSVAKLVAGNMNPESLKEQKRVLGIADNAKFRVFLFDVKNEDLEDKGKSHTEDLIQAANEFIEKSPNQGFLPPVTYRGLVLMLAGMEDEYTLDNRTAYLYKYIKDWMQEKRSLQIAVGISSIFTDLAACPAAVREAMEMLHKGANKQETESSLVLYEEYTSQVYTRNIYDIVLEEELKNSVKNGSYTEACHLVDLILDKLTTKKIYGLERRFYILRLMTAVLSVPTNSGMALADIFPEGDKSLPDFGEIYRQEDLKKSFREKLLKPVCDACRNAHESEESETVQKIMQLVREHDGDITLNEVADQLSYSPTYLWKLLKKEKNRTFTDIANEVKMERARDYLLTTDMTVAEIAEKMHYTNVQNFIRFFSKYESTTPARYRKEHRK